MYSKTELHPTELAVTIKIIIDARAGVRRQPGDQTQITLRSSYWRSRPGGTSSPSSG